MGGGGCQNSPSPQKYIFFNNPPEIELLFMSLLWEDPFSQAISSECRLLCGIAKISRPLRVPDFLLNLNVNS